MIRALQIPVLYLLTLFVLVVTMSYVFGNLEAMVVPDLYVNNSAQVILPR